MSDGIVVSAASFTNILSTLRVLVPKGDTEMPIGVYVNNGVLTIVCTQGCVYQAEVEIDDITTVAETTVLYRDISTLVPMTGEVELEFNSTYMSIHGEGFDADFPAAFSVVEKYNFSEVTFVEITSSMYLSGLMTILGTGLERLYNKISRIMIWDSVAVQKFPNVWIQVRANGLPVEAVLDTSHVKLLTQFSPTKVSISDASTLVFSNKTATLQLPCRPVQDKTKITELMSDMTPVSQFNISSYLEKLRSAVRFGAKEHCKIALHSSGIRTILSHSNVSVKVSMGDIHSDVVGVFELPIQLWLSLLRGIGSENVEVLYGGNKVCLRTPFTIIVAHVLR